MGQGYFKQKPMKTAMQELRDSINTSYTHMTMARETKDIYIYKLALKEALDKIDALLEKEKEQLLNAFRDDSWNKSFNEYYNQTYNQNK